MKNWIVLIFALFAVACGNDGGGGSTPVTTTTTAVTTPLTSCIDGTTYCNNQYYASAPGFMPYPGTYGYAYDYRAYFNQNGFCNCPRGTAPVYNPTYGLGCIQTRYLMQNYYGGGNYNNNGAYMYWQFQSGSSSWNTGWYTANDYYWSYYSAPQMPNNFAQSSNIPNGGYYGGSGGNCSKNLTQSCLLNQANTCGTGATCRQVISGSALGVCANY